MSVTICPSDVGREKLTFCLLVRFIHTGLGLLLLTTIVVFMVSVPPMTSMHKYVHNWTKQEYQVRPIVEELFLVCIPEEIPSGKRCSENKNGNPGKVAEPVQRFLAINNS